MRVAIASTRRNKRVSERTNERASEWVSERAQVEARERVTMEPLAVSIQGACAAIGVKRSTLYTLMGSRQLPSVKVGKRRLILVSAIRAYLERLEANAENLGA